MPQYFDIHSHLNFSDYQKDLDEVIGRLKETETHTIVVGTDFASSKQAVELADKYEEIYACIGIHPINTPLPTLPLIRGGQGWGELVKHPKVVAIGECGLDFYHAKKEEDYERQKKLFLDQIEFALTYNKPIMIHARDAYEEILEILENHSQLGSLASKLRGNVHFFAGSLEVARRFFAIGFSISFTGVITFTHDYDEVIRQAPLGSIMSETDSPYVAPIPYRGKRNEPSYVSEVVKRMAEIRGEDLELVRVALVNNALNMIG